MKRISKDANELAEIASDLRNEGMGIAEIARTIREGNVFVTNVLKANHAQGRRVLDQSKSFVQPSKANLALLRLVNTAHERSAMFGVTWIEFNLH